MNHSPAYELRFFITLAVFLVAVIIDNGMVIWLRKTGRSTAHWKTIIQDHWPLSKVLAVKALLTLGVLGWFYSEYGERLFVDVAVFTYILAIGLSFGKQWRLHQKQLVTDRGNEE